MDLLIPQKLSTDKLSYSTKKNETYLEKLKGYNTRGILKTSLKIFIPQSFWVETM